MAQADQVVGQGGDLAVGAERSVQVVGAADDTRKLLAGLWLDAVDILSRILHNHQVRIGARGQRIERQQPRAIEVLGLIDQDDVELAKPERLFVFQL